MFPNELIKINPRLIKKIGLALIVVLAGCSKPPARVAKTFLPPPNPLERIKVPAENKPIELDLLPSEEEVNQGVLSGRYDPFSSPLSLDAPLGFQLKGIIGSINYKLAYVEYYEEAGFLKIGDIGGTETNLLPKGWLVKDIDIETGSLHLTSRGINAIIKL